MIKKLAYKTVMFLIKHFLLRDAWLVTKSVNSKGDTQSVSYPEQIKVVYLGSEFFGFIDKKNSQLEGVNFTLDTPQCVSFSENEYLYETFDDAEDFYLVARDTVKPEKTKIIAKGPSYDKKSAPVRYSPIGPKKTTRKGGRKK